MTPEVRYQMLRPAQIVERRKACPIAYVPLGNLEWHGVHNCVGTDTFQAEGLAIACAQQGGGLAFPSLWYGENRSEGLMEANARDRDQIAAGMKLPPDNFRPERMPFAPTEQAINYHKLLVHILAQVESLGFEIGVLVAGHYPLVDHARAAVLQFSQREYSKRHGMLAWAFVDYLLVRDQFDVAGDHAGGWETSHMMALHPARRSTSACCRPRASRWWGPEANWPRRTRRRILEGKHSRLPLLLRCGRGNASPGEQDDVPRPWELSPRRIVARNG